MPIQNAKPPTLLHHCLATWDGSATSNAQGLCRVYHGVWGKTPRSNEANQKAEGNTGEKEERKIFRVLQNRAHGKSGDTSRKTRMRDTTYHIWHVDFQVKTYMHCSQGLWYIQTVGHKVGSAWILQGHS